MSDEPKNPYDGRLRWLQHNAWNEGSKSMREHYEADKHSMLETIRIEAKLHGEAKAKILQLESNIYHLSQVDECTPAERAVLEAIPGFEQWLRDRAEYFRLNPQVCRTYQECLTELALRKG